MARAWDRAGYEGLLGLREQRHWCEGFGFGVCNNLTAFGRESRHPRVSTGRAVGARWSRRCNRRCSTVLSDGTCGRFAQRLTQELLILEAHGTVLARGDHVRTVDVTVFADVTILAGIAGSGAQEVEPYSKRTC